VNLVILNRFYFYLTLLRHPADSPQWKKINETFSGCGVELRNLRLELVTDGMNHYGNLSSKHNSWPIL